MFKLFRRAEAPAAPRKPEAQAPRFAKRSRPAPLVPELPPLPEVREDNDESAWDLWQESSFQLDSQLGALTPEKSVRVRQERPSQFGDPEDPDPFTRVGKNGT
ncbi:hypothetical protein EZ313_21125 [Ramlibacter henchirensis]|uniref:Uncharacterized protein n=1 Tax=Ramlibacter henchirensis TaxID=204072 RepID=A0A4Z0BNP8_9BURK|nr:hypothetical protein [Ramlibacter henchirensis]TFZ00936.1 hypothetical protein EZ313_21125 [Ramlibacter henchirensis]